MSKSHNLEEVFENEKRYLMQTYKRGRIVLKSGKGAIVTDLSGNEYIDCVGGIAVNAVGHCHPAVVNAMKEQAEKLIHVSNLYYSEPQVKLAEKLIEISSSSSCGDRGMAKVFFCNSGTESIEAALKLACKVTGKHNFIATEGSFHGRTLGSLSLTAGKKFRTAFEALLLKNVKFIRYNDARAIKTAIDSDTSAVILEPIQGEAGVIVPSDGYLEEVREICTRKGVLLILDEIQTGFGRTGLWFGKDHDRVEPDIMTVAKAMGAGFPIGAVLAKDGLEFEIGEHGTTFGGSPLACATALASINVIEEEKLVERAREHGKYFMNGLNNLYTGENRLKLSTGSGSGSGNIKEIRGKGLMIAIELTNPSSEIIAKKAIDLGVLINCTSETVIRLVPPLVISKKEIDEVIAVLNDALVSA